VPEVDGDRDHGVRLGRATVCRSDCLRRGGSCGLVVRLPGAAPRACGDAPEASTATAATQRSCPARGAEPSAPAGSLVGVPGAARDPAAVASAHGPSTVDLPNRVHGTTAGGRPGAATDRPACPRESAVGLPADPRRTAERGLPGVDQLDPQSAARSRHPPSAPTRADDLAVVPPRRNRSSLRGWPAVSQAAPPGCWGQSCEATGCGCVASQVASSAAGIGLAR